MKNFGTKIAQWQKLCLLKLTYSIFVCSQIYVLENFALLKLTYSKFFAGTLNVEIKKFFEPLTTI